MDDQNDNVKDVFAHYGLAAYHAQCLEAEIKNVFLLTIRATSKNLPPIFLDGAELTLNKQMMGVLIRDLKTICEFGQDAERRPRFWTFGPNIMNSDDNPELGRDQHVDEMRANIRRSMRNLVIVIKNSAYAEKLSAADFDRSV
ncbi:MAG TPA: hypothetical protein DCZ95_03980 [Verrucomicrobia bacterium]|nr:hypothetical protein [Verrucomicrobiota bacterium]